MKKILLVLAILVAFALSSQATVTWAGEHHIKEVSLSGGVKAYQYDQTNFFGQDYSGATVVGPPSQQPPILRLQSGSITESTTTTTFSRCKEKKDGRYTQAYFVGEEKKVIKQAGFQDAVNPANGQPPWTATIGGSGPSTGNMAIPALISGGAFVGGNAVAPGMSVVTNAVSKSKSAGGKGGEGGKVGPIINDNTNINPNTNITKVNTVSGSSSSASGTGVGVATSN